MPTTGVHRNEGTEISWDRIRTLGTTNETDYATPAYQSYRDGAAIVIGSGATLTVSEAGTYKLMVITSGER